MGAIASLGQTTLEVEPGHQVTTTLRVRNAGDVVDQFSFEVLGDASGWTSVEPAVVRLLPDAEEEVQVTFAPPRAANARAGRVPFGIKVVSQEDPQGSVVEEGAVDVGAFAAVTAELIPRTTRGRRSAKQDLAVDNRGNEPLNADVLVFDENEALDFSLDDPTIVAEPGHATFTTLRVSPRKRFWRGPDRTIPYQLQLRPSDDEPPVAVDGSLLQQAMLPKWLPKALLLLLGLLILLAVLWWTLLRPAIESAAREAVEEPLAEQAAATEALQESVAQAQEDAAAAAAGADEEGEAPPPEPEEEPEEVDEVGEELAAEPIELRTPTDFRRSVTTASTAASASETPDDGELLEVTDIILQNPGGDEGLVRVRRGSQTLLEVALQNFRDLDYHFVAPLVFTSEAGVNIQVVCQNDEGSCTAAALFSGQTVSFEEPE